MTGCLKIKNDAYYALLNLKVGNKYKQKWTSTKLKTLIQAIFYLLITYKITSVRLDGKPGGLAPRTIKSHSFIIKEGLDDTLVNEIILASKILIPKQVKQHKETFFNAEKTNEVLKLFNGYKLQPLIYITLYYGLRKSEVLGLKWSAIDFKKGGIKINHTGGIKHTSLIAKNKTKTEASRREYNLLPEIKENLLKVKSEQKVFEKEYQNTDYIFTWPDGRLYHLNYVTKKFQNVLTKNNFPKCVFMIQNIVAQVLSMINSSN